MSDDAAGAQDQAQREEAPIQRGLVTASIMLATIMQVLDTTIANVALPSMQGSLNATRDTVTWVLTSYIVAAAIATPLTGWLSDRFGRKRLFLVSIAGFTMASMLCGIATGINEMVLFRLLQGLFGAALVPLSQAVLLDINPKERHGQAMAIWGAGIMVGPIVGPTLGGWLTETFSWRWTFYVNLPVGLLAFLGVLAFMPEARLRIRRFDFLGFALLSLFIGGLQMMLDRGEQLGWLSSPEILIEAGLAVSALWMFVIHMATHDQPFIEPAMLKDRNFATGLIFIFTIGIILLATMALLPPMLQNVLGYPTITSGLVMAPRGVGTMISMVLVGRLVGKLDPRLLILAGLLLTALSLFQMTGFSPEMGNGPILLSGIVQGLGLGLVFVPLSTLAFATLRPDLRTEASSLFSLVRNIGSSIGISIVTVVLTQNSAINHAELAEHVSPFHRAIDGVALPNGATLAEGSATVLAWVDQIVTRQALMISYLNDFKLMAFVALACIPMLFLLRAPQRTAPADAGHAVMD